MCIGFLARLSNEKNPGLMILAAHSILQEQPLVRFNILGSGDLLSALQNLCARLDIDDFVHFAGWIAHDRLPIVLSKLDIVINTSIRGWSETFCISNIEVMSIGVPLITFAVGGIGEYVERPPPVDKTVQCHVDRISLLQTAPIDGCASSTASILDDDNDLLYTVGINAVLLNEASPLAISAAVSLLAGNSTLRQQIGLAGRKTVQDRFSVVRQMEEYTALYQHLTIRGRKKRRQDN